MAGRSVLERAGETCLARPWSRQAWPRTRRGPARWPAAIGTAPVPRGCWRRAPIARQRDWRRPRGCPRPARRPLILSGDCHQRAGLLGKAAEWLRHDRDEFGAPLADPAELGERGDRRQACEQRPPCPTPRLRRSPETAVGERARGTIASAAIRERSLQGREHQVPGNIRQRGGIAPIGQCRQSVRHAHGARRDHPQLLSGPWSAAPSPRGLARLMPIAPASSAGSRAPAAVRSPAARGWPSNRAANTPVAPPGPGNRGRRPGSPAGASSPAAFVRP